MELLVIAGPTACNKSQLGIKLAKQLNGEIVSADSLQVYKYMDIGTAKVQDTCGIPHHLVDVIEPNCPFSVAKYQEMAVTAIAHIHNRGKLPILVGGSGFYINALLYKVGFNHKSYNLQYRNDLYALAAKKGTTHIFEILQKVDPVYAQANSHNTARLIRGLEYYQQTGTTISAHNEIQKKQPLAYNAKVFLIDLPREQLYENINNRVDTMIGQGLVKEVEELLNMGYNRNLTPLGSIGYKEIIAYINGDITLEQAISEIKQNTRRFAKRQLTWFRNKTEGQWVQNDANTILEKINQC
ncbi:MAG: tRNA (adenosine(37)-N6)-dimethylallyltransferase MiaA [Defluviitaleaceae bacterium]|nr:tRNA (adenosine(37)-N6)-dimethylallyltransferase MiaA [Defluviitaleaceae bacterium]